MTKVDLSKYKTIIFDCDGVVLDSNKVKSDAFFLAALPYGQKAAQEFVEYHKANGGVSRYKKFQYFLENIIEDEISSLGYNELLDAYAKEVVEGMISCEVTKGLEKLREETRYVNWLIASGGDQAELREIFTKRKLIDLFDGGIFGSPDTKENIFQREIEKNNIKTPALFLGDSKYDYLASSKVEGIDFIFISQWSEVINWEKWTKENNIRYIAQIKDIV